MVSKEHAEVHGVGCDNSIFKQSFDKEAAKRFYITIFSKCVSCDLYTSLDLLSKLKHKSLFCLVVSDTNVLFQHKSRAEQRPCIAISDIGLLLRSCSIFNVSIVADVSEAICCRRFPVGWLHNHFGPTHVCGKGVGWDLFRAHGVSGEKYYEAVIFCVTDFLWVLVHLVALKR